MVLLDQELKVTSVTHAGQQWLKRLPSGSEIALQSLALRVGKQAGEERTGHARIRLRTGEWVTARVAPVRGGSDQAGLAAITLEPTEGIELSQMLSRV